MPWGTNKRSPPLEGIRARAIGLPSPQHVRKEEDTLLPTKLARTAARRRSKSEHDHMKHNERGFLVMASSRERAPLNKASVLKIIGESRALHQNLAAERSQTSSSVLVQVVLTQRITVGVEYGEPKIPSIWYDMIWSKYVEKHKLRYYSE
jgi:hypothetical protein